MIGLHPACTRTCELRHPRVRRLVVVHFFTETFGAGTRSIVRNKAIVQKMAMPREMFPVASMLVSLFHVGPQVVILPIACVFVRLDRPTRSGSAAVLLGRRSSSACSAPRSALLFSAANVFFRDFGQRRQHPDELRPLRRADDLPLQPGRGPVRRGRAVLPLQPDVRRGAADAARRSGSAPPTTPRPPRPRTCPTHLMLIGLAMLGVSLVVLGLVAADLHPAREPASRSAL